MKTKDEIEEVVMVINVIS